MITIFPFRGGPAAFGRCARGNVAIAAAIGIFVLASAAGGAVDYMRAQSVRAKLQAAADAAARVAGANPNLERHATLQKMSDEYFHANLAVGRDVEIVDTGIEKVSDGYAYTATVKVDTTLLGLVGLRQLDIKVRSQVKPVPGDTGPLSS